MKLNKLKLSVKSIGKTSLLFILILSACAYRSGWEGDRNQFIGVKIQSQNIFDENYYLELGRFFYSWNSYKGANKLSNKGFDDVLLEGLNTRYYITYGGPCKYSILFDKNNVMLSWRYETKHRSRCTVH